MKRINLIVLGLVILVSCNPNIKDEDLEIVKAKTTLNNIPFTGTSHRYFENGVLANIMNYRNGIPIGSWISYGYEGETIQIGEYLENTNLQNNAIRKFNCKRVDLDIWKEGEHEFADIFLESPADTLNFLDRMKNIVENSNDNFQNYFHGFHQIGIIVHIFNDNKSNRVLGMKCGIKNGKLYHIKSKMLQN